MSRVQGGHGFISVPLILLVPQLFEMNYQSILLGRVYVSKSGFNSVQIIKTPFVKVLLSDCDCVVLFIKREAYISIVSLLPTLELLFRERNIQYTTAFPLY